MTAKSTNCTDSRLRVSHSAAKSATWKQSSPTISGSVQSTASYHLTMTWLYLARKERCICDTMASMVSVKMLRDTVATVKIADTFEHGYM